MSAGTSRGSSRLKTPNPSQVEVTSRQLAKMVGELRHGVYPEGKSHASRLTYTADGKTIRRPKLASYARVDQRGAIHEASHAVVAWSLGRKVSELAYEAGIWIECGIMVEGQVGYVRREDLLAFDAEGEADVDDVTEECAIAYAGCVAEARYAHGALVYCMNSSGGEDVAQIRKCLKKGRCPLGGVEHQQALTMARRITAKYRLLICAVAEVLLARFSLDKDDFLEILAKLGYTTKGDEDEERRRQLKENEKLAQIISLELRCDSPSKGSRLKRTAIQLKSSLSAESEAQR